MIASALPLLVVIAAIVALGATGNLFATSPLVIAAQAGAVALSVWARRSFQKGTFRVTATPGSGSIIRGGPYQFLRHPMYAAALLFIWTAVVSHVSVFTLAIGVVVAAVVVTRVVVEERLLRARYPEYDDYAHLRRPWCRMCSSVIRGAGGPRRGTLHDGRRAEKGRVREIPGRQDGWLPEAPETYPAQILER